MFCEVLSLIEDNIKQLTEKQNKILSQLESRTNKLWAV